MKPNPKTKPKPKPKPKPNPNPNSNPNPNPNPNQDPAILLKKYEHEIADLKRELSMHNSLASRGRVSYEPYSEQQRAELLEKLESFFNHDLDELELESVRQMRELLAAARQLYGAKKGELESLTQRFANGEISLPGEAQGEGADGADGGEGD